MADPPLLVLATRNPGKLRELRRLLAPGLWDLITLDDAGFHGDLDEPGPGYAENAQAKAEAVTAATGRPALGEDSGIEIVALGGWPGPASARWMGPGASDVDRLHGLIAEVDRRSPGDRRCRYVAVVAISRPGVPTETAQGMCEGHLTTPEGEGGFGYDPAFFSTDLGVRFAQAGEGRKDAVSHRARALAALAAAGALRAGG